MITTETLQQVGQGPAIAAAASAALQADNILALPNNFSVHDLEKMQTQRRRSRGTMTTCGLSAFSTYVNDRALEGATVFVDSKKMQATAVLNLGTLDDPGHADDIAIYTPQATAAYTALQAIADGRGKSQREVAEWLEDWGHIVTAAHGDDVLTVTQAVAAIRKVTIEALSKSETTQEQLSASRSAFDQVKAVSNDGKIPTLFNVALEPYTGFAGRLFVVRLAILTSEKAPTFTLRIVKAEEHAEQMAEELVGHVSAVIDGPPVLIGGYVARA